MFFLVVRSFLRRIFKDVLRWASLSGESGVGEVEFRGIGRCWGFWGFLGFMYIFLFRSRLGFLFRVGIFLLSRDFFGIRFILGFMIFVFRSRFLFSFCDWLFILSLGDGG